MSVDAYRAGAAHGGRRAVRQMTGSASLPATGPLGLAGLCVLALGLTWVVAELVPAAHVRDAAALHDFTLLGRPHVDAVASALLGLLDPIPFTVGGAVLVAIALARGRPRVALAVTLVLVLAPVSAETLKPLLAHPHASVGATHIGQASWPSGHSTAALALVLCCVLVAPSRLRPAALALGGLFAAAVGVSLLILAWHLPSAVLGGYLLAGLWVALAVAGLRAADRLRPSARLRPRSGGPRLRARAVRARVPE
jgi:membrane-associated phospholipid phosphatase